MCFNFALRKRYKTRLHRCSTASENGLISIREQTTYWDILRKIILIIFLDGNIKILPKSLIFLFLVIDPSNKICLINFLSKVQKMFLRTRMRTNSKKMRILKIRTKSFYYWKNVFARCYSQIIDAYCRSLRYKISEFTSIDSLVISIWKRRWLENIFFRINVVKK